LDILFLYLLKNKKECLKSMVIFIEAKTFSRHLCMSAGTGAPVQLVTVVSSPKINTTCHEARQSSPLSTAVV
jgi:hypothetical protein